MTFKPYAPLNSRITSRAVSEVRAKRLLARAYESRFVRNVAVVASGTAGAQAIAMAFSPVITRLYGLEAFGLLGTFTAIAGIFTNVAALSYPIAIVLPKEDSEANGLARLSFFVALVQAAILAVVIAAAGDWLVKTLHLQVIHLFVPLISLMMIFAAWLQINQQWLVRKNQFKVTARVDVLQTLIVNCAKSGIGLFKPIAAVLVVLYTLGSGIQASMLYFGAKKIFRGAL